MTNRKYTYLSDWETAKIEQLIEKALKKEMDYIMTESLEKLKDKINKAAQIRLNNF